TRLGSRGHRHDGNDGYGDQGFHFTHTPICCVVFDTPTEPPGMHAGQSCPPILCVPCELCARAGRKPPQSPASLTANQEMRTMLPRTLLSLAALALLSLPAAADGDPLADLIDTS